ncbi:MAG: GNAT family N-acetyltransferase [Defluviitaleaceae bacterium]|nr:GNAT family N-acetyltransferase [Defluviitaleaceae bacterium]
MKIINASYKDLEAVYNLVCELEDTKLNKNNFTQIYTDNLNDPNIFYLIAIEEEDIIGFGSLHIQKLLHHCAKVGEIQEIVVIKAHQGAGIGGQLFAALHQLAVSNGCLQLEVCCNENRTASHKFYLKQGMAESHFKYTL